MIKKWMGLEPKNLTITGELAFRINRNFSRLEDKMYRPEQIFGADQNGWPGDWEGRTILALALEEAVTHRKAAFLEDNCAALEKEWNEKGYLKEVYPEGSFNEQQLSGHNWLLRGLMAVYDNTGEEKYADRVKHIIKELYLPVAGHYREYPLDPAFRSKGGAEAGNIEGNAINGWMLSTDIGCAYMCFDALTEAYDRFTDWEEAPLLKALLEEMFETFSGIDFEGVCMQTHATLSALRGILQFYETTGKEEYLSFAERIFVLYQKKGMTENYANYNWFGRPLWTEPCAIVDSYMVAMELYKLTEKEEYLSVANKILYNGFLAAQRPNGGFGCDSCTGAGEEAEFLRVKAYEAYWCCSMRGAEGLSYAASNAVLEDEEGNLTFTNYVPGDFHTKVADVHVESAYPAENQVHISFRKVKRPICIALYLPEGSKNWKTVFESAAGHGTDSKEASAVCKEAATQAPVDKTAEALYQNAGTQQEAGSLRYIFVTGDGALALTFETQRLQKDTVGDCSNPGLQAFWQGDQILGQTEDGVEIPLYQRMYLEGLEKKPVKISASKDEDIVRGIQILGRVTKEYI